MQSTQKILKCNRNSNETLKGYLDWNKWSGCCGNFKSKRLYILYEILLEMGNNSLNLFFVFGYREYFSKLNRIAPLLCFVSN